MSKLASLADIAIRKPLVTITEADVDQVITALRRQRTRWNPIRGAARLGDRVSLTYTVRRGDKVIEDHRARRRRVVIGSATLHKNLERRHLVGARVGEQVVAMVQLPRDYPTAEFAGKRVTYTMTVRAVSRPVLPALDKDFARRVGLGKGGVKSLRKQVRAVMQAKVDAIIKQIVWEQVMEALLLHYPLTVDETAIDQEADRRLRRRRGKGKAQQGDHDASAQARAFAKLNAIVGDIVRTHHLTLDTKRLETVASALALRSDDPDSQIDKFESDYKIRSRVEANVLEDQAIERVLEHANVETYRTTYRALMFENQRGAQGAQRPHWPIIELRADNKCSFCGTSKCCTYITHKIPAPRAKSDFSHLLWQISHHNVAAYKDSDGWYLSFETPCQHLESDGRCGIYGDRPQICRDYSNKKCEFDGDAKDGYELYFPGYDSLLEYCKKRFSRWGS